jgi:hypothetical protein
MKITRRNFDQSLGTVAAITVSGVGANSAFGFQNADGKSIAGSSASGLFAMSEDQVRNLVGRSFIAVAAEGRNVELVLTEVNSVRRPANAKRGYSGNCFSAIFKTKRNSTLDQGIYEMKSAGLDRFSALLVPTGRRRTEFELVVNNLSR